MNTNAHNTLSAIGNTPLVRLHNIVSEKCADIYLKLEYLNPTGSFKDRMAQAIIEEAEQRGTLRPGMTVVECTAGSTGTAIAFVCAVKGYRFQVISSDAFAKEKLQSMRALGGGYSDCSERRRPHYARLNPTYDWSGFGDGEAFRKLLDAPV